MLSNSNPHGSPKPNLVKVEVIIDENDLPVSVKDTVIKQIDILNEEIRICKIYLSMPHSINANEMVNEIFFQEVTT